MKPDCVPLLNEAENVGFLWERTPVNLKRQANTA